MKSMFAFVRRNMEKRESGRIVLEFLRKIRFEESLFFLCDLIEPSFGEKNIANANEVFSENEIVLQNFMDALEDEESKITLKNIIEFRLTGKRILYKVKKPEKEQYFMNKKYKSIIPLKDEYFVDCGAYIGDTLEKFIKVGGTFNKYYAFEPNEKNCEIIKSKYENDKIEIYPYALGRESGIAYFDYDDISPNTQVKKEGENIVKIVSLDETLKNKKVTFIKMDIEGAELDALVGACEIISSQKPILAISIYHSNEDILRIWEYIHSLNCGYKYYVRHYSMFYNETVLYCV